MSAAGAVCHGQLGGVGGCDDGALSSVERYDPAANAWEAVAPMATARVALGVAVFEGKLYAVGGMSEDIEDEAGEEEEVETPANTVERFDPASNAWEVVAPMATGRAFPFALLM